MLLTWLSAVIGLSTLTVIGTVLPFSTSGGISSLTLPVRTAASPTTFRIAVVSIAGVASAGRTVRTGTSPSTAALPASVRNWRRVESSDRCIVSFLFTQRHQIRHDILDLFGREDRFSLPGSPDAIEPIRPIVGWHDRRGIEARGIDQPEPKLAL